MGIAKHQFERDNEYYQIAFRTMMEIGAINTCDMHDVFWYNTHKYENKEIYRIVTAKINEKNGKLDDYKLFHKKIDEILSYAGDCASACPYCDKISRE